MAEDKKRSSRIVDCKVRAVTFDRFEGLTVNYDLMGELSTKDQEGKDSFINTVIGSTYLSHNKDQPVPWVNEEKINSAVLNLLQALEEDITTKLFGEDKDIYEEEIIDAELGPDTDSENTGEPGSQ